jgi:hypothetical protein
MAISNLNQYNVADFLNWHTEGSLELNPHFQRRAVWTPSARSYLIDTILLQLPIPKIYIRTKINLKTRASIREVVDGQQRLRAIIDFASNRFSIDKRSEQFSGQTYETLPDENKDMFLRYDFSVEQLINASDNDVLEIFARLNSYNVRLNPAEQRHGEFQGDFKWAVRNSALKWAILWDKFGILSVSRRARMADDEFMAQMLGILIEGIVDGNQSNIRNLYQRFDSEFTDQERIIQQLDKIISFIVNELSDAIQGPVARPPHFLMLFAAVAHALVGIPKGQIEGSMPQHHSDALSNIRMATENIITLSAVIESDTPPNGRYLDFWTASKSSTTRISSRSIRFPMYYLALLPTHL